MTHLCAVFTFSKNENKTQMFSSETDDNGGIDGRHGILEIWKTLSSRIALHWAICLIIAMCVCVCGVFFWGGVYRCSFSFSITNFDSFSIEFVTEDAALPLQSGGHQKGWHAMLVEVLRMWRRLVQRDHCHGSFRWQTSESLYHPPYHPQGTDATSGTQRA